MNDNLLWALRGIANQHSSALEDVWRTIEILTEAQQVVVVAESDCKLFLVSVDLENKKIYIILNLLQLGTSKSQWFLQQAELYKYSRQPVFSDPDHIDMALAILKMGSGINTQGLTLDLSLLDPSEYDANIIFIFEEGGKISGVFKIDQHNKITLTTSASVGIVASNALKITIPNLKHSNSKNINFIFETDDFYDLQKI